MPSMNDASTTSRDLAAPAVSLGEVLLTIFLVLALALFAHELFAASRSGMDAEARAEPAPVRREAQAASPAFGLGLGNHWPVFRNLRK